jgi:hypothetical protein
MIMTMMMTTTIATAAAAAGTTILMTILNLQCKRISNIYNILI